MEDKHTTTTKQIVVSAHYFIFEQSYWIVVMFILGHHMSCPYSLKLIHVHVLNMHGFLLLGAVHQGNIIFIDLFIVNFNM